MAEFSNVMPGTEISGAQKTVLPPQDRPRHLITARFLPPSRIDLSFADASFSLPIELLEMPLDRIQWETAMASPKGDAMIVQAVKGESIPIDSSTLRYLVDPVYAAEIDASLKELQLTREELGQLAKQNPPASAWFSEPERDLRRDSWK